MRELSLGDDVLVVTAGIATEEAMRAREALRRAGVSIRHLHLNTFKPFDRRGAARPSRRRALRRRSRSRTTSPRAASASLVAETIADHGVGKQLIRLGLKDTFAHGGSRPYLMRYYGLDALALVARGRAPARARKPASPKPTSPPFASTPSTPRPKRRRCDVSLFRDLSDLRGERRRGERARGAGLRSSRRWRFRATSCRAAISPTRSSARSNRSRTRAAGAISPGSPTARTASATSFPSSST